MTLFALHGSEFELLIACCGEPTMRTHSHPLRMATFCLILADSTTTVAVLRLLDLFRLSGRPSQCKT